MTMNPMQFGTVRHELASAQVAPADDSTAYVSNVLTAHWARGQGHGTRLMEDIASQADSSGTSLLLHARDELHPWYSKLGFEEADDVPPLAGTKAMRRRPRS